MVIAVLVEWQSRVEVQRNGGPLKVFGESLCYHLTQELHKLRALGRSGGDSVVVAERV